jgi:hypothetical protein
MALDKNQVRNIRKTLQEALDLIKDEVGMELQLGNASFFGHNVTFKLEVSVPNEDGETVSKEAEDFIAYCGRWDLSSEDLNREFNDSQMGTCKIVGCKPRSHKYPILIENAVGKIYKFPADRVKRALGMSVTSF